MDGVHPKPFFEMRIPHEKGIPVEVQVVGAKGEVCVIFGKSSYCFQEQRIPIDNSVDMLKGIVKKMFGEQ